MSHPGKYELVQSAISMRLVRVIDDRCEIDLHLHDSCLKTTAIDFREILRLFIPYFYMVNTSIAYLSFLRKIDSIIRVTRTSKIQSICRINSFTNKAVTEAA
ncbi:hypothetical protein V1478_004309 [Vespula squamosa]|uniref:Uncharacterized protein n=1 Tax=Vespula squamosa TaxID=30214 RepID=A0ABD2BHE5_VESSQ